MSATPKKETPYQAPQSPCIDLAVITSSKADAEALGTDAVFANTRTALNQSLKYLNCYNEVMVAISDHEKALKIACCLREADKHLPISVVKEDTWKGAASVQDFMEAQKLHPAKVVEALGADAEYIPDGGCYKPNSNECIDLRTQNSILTEIFCLDSELGGLRYGEVSMGVGCSGHGKSTLADQFVLAAVAQEIKTCVFSGELSQTQHNTWLFGQAAGKDGIEWAQQEGTGKRFPVVKDDELKARIQDALSAYTDFIDCDDGILSFEALMRCFYTHVRQGYKFFVVDNIMALTIDAGDKEFSMQADMIYRLVRFAAKWNVHVLVLAHPKKSDSEIKGLSDIYGASKMANWVHEVLAIHKFSPEEKEKYEKTHPGKQSADTRIRILKSRVAPSDKAVYLNFDKAGRRFYAAGDYPCFPWEARPDDGVDANGNGCDFNDNDLPFPVGEQVDIFEESPHSQSA